MKSSLYFVFTGLLALSACSETRYSESPIMEKYVLSQAPGLAASAIRRVELCDVRSAQSPAGGTFISVLFDDDALYHYKVDWAELRFTLQYSTARWDRESDVFAKELNKKSCLFRAGRYVINRDVVPVGGLRQRMTHNVRMDVADVRRFDDDGVQAELKLVAQAVTAAVEAQKRQVSPRASWGVAK